MKKRYQKNFAAVHSNPIIAYTITPYTVAWTNAYGSSIMT
jgi:hypothetical protein